MDAAKHNNAYRLATQLFRTGDTERTGDERDKGIHRKQSPEVGAGPGKSGLYIVNAGTGYGRMIIRPYKSRTMIYR